MRARVATFAGETRGADYDREIEILRELLNDSFFENPYFVPITGDEFRFQIGPFKRVMDPAISLVAEMDGDDRLTLRGARSGLPPVVEVDQELAWLLGLYTAEGSRRRHQFTVSSTDQSILDRVEATLAAIGLPVYRAAGAITCCSAFTSAVLAWLGTGSRAQEKRIPPIVFGWPTALIEAVMRSDVRSGMPSFVIPR